MVFQLGENLTLISVHPPNVESAVLRGFCLSLRSMLVLVFTCLCIRCLSLSKIYFRITEFFFFISTNILLKQWYSTFNNQNTKKIDNFKRKILHPRYYLFIYLDFFVFRDRCHYRLSFLTRFLLKFLFFLLIFIQKIFLKRNLQHIFYVFFACLLLKNLSVHFLKGYLRKLLESFLHLCNKFTFKKTAKTAFILWKTYSIKGFCQGTVLNKGIKGTSI